jgi:NAD(P)-dependent dehydrogenase (short-subunit alcohol dehydrogenase family)
MFCVERDAEWFNRRMRFLFEALIITLKGHQFLVRLLMTVCVQMPLGRMEWPADLGKAVVFLCSPDAAYITGALRLWCCPCSYV